MTLLPSRLGALLALLCAATAGCNGGPPRPPVGIDAGPPPICASIPGAGVVCVGDVAYTCAGGSELPSASEDCPGSGQACVPTLGCRPCVPLTVRCDGETVELCRADGSGYDRGETCDVAAGLRCSPDGCLDLCARAAAEESYVGCEYWPTTLRNAQLADGFPFAVAVANPQLVPAVVTVEAPALLFEPISRTIAPGALELIELPWNDTLRNDLGEAASVLAPAGAYRLRSDVPVTVTQFNPLSFQLATMCSDRTECFSFTNDASLLLPTHVLTGSYVAMSRPTQLLRLNGTASISSGFVAIVGTSELPAAVEVRVTAPTLAGRAGTDLMALVPGTPASFMLAAGDVLQLLSAAPATCPGPTRTETVTSSMGETVIEYCDTGRGFDLTGTEIRSNAPVAVFSGHDCTFVPYDRWACDHLEEQIFPVESLAGDVFVPGTRPSRPGEPNLLRIVSAVDGNVVRFEPPLEGVAETTMLDRGDFVEVEIRSPVWARATGAILGAVFLVGQDYAGIGSAGRLAVGDPAMALVVPSAQFRTDYAILAPDTYTHSWIDVAAPVGAFVTLDGVLLREPSDVDGTGMMVGHVEIEPGTHVLEGTAPFGLYVSGLATYTSYYVPGGMDFEPITPPF